MCGDHLQEIDFSLLQIKRRDLSGFCEDAEKHYGLMDPRVMVGLRFSQNSLLKTVHYLFLRKE